MNDKLASLLKKAGVAAIGSLLLTAGAASADTIKEQAKAAAEETAAAAHNPEKNASCTKQDAKKEAKKDKKDKKDKKKKHGKKTRLEKKHPERASGSK